MATRIKKNAAKTAKKIEQQIQAGSHGQIDPEADEECLVGQETLAWDGTPITRPVPISHLKPRHLHMQWIGDSAAEDGRGTEEPVNITYIDRIRELASELSDVRPLSYDEWVERFNRDQNPDRKIMAWYFTSIILRIMTDKYDYNAEQRDDCFQILSTLITMPRSIAINILEKESLLPSVQIEEIIKLHYGGKYTWKGYLMLTSIVY